MSVEVEKDSNTNNTYTCYREPHDRTTGKCNEQGLCRIRFVHICCLGSPYIGTCCCIHPKKTCKHGRDCTTYIGYSCLISQTIGQSKEYYNNKDYQYQILSSQICHSPCMYLACNVFHPFRSFRLP